MTVNIALSSLTCHIDGILVILKIDDVWLLSV